MSKTDQLRWQSHLPALIKETLENSSDQSGALLMPWRITMQKLYEVAEVAQRINDPELNLLMCELALYTAGDPYHKDYQPKVIEQLQQQVTKMKK